MEKDDKDKITLKEEDLENVTGGSFTSRKGTGTEPKRTCPYCNCAVNASEYDSHVEECSKQNPGPVNSRFI